MRSPASRRSDEKVTVVDLSALTSALLIANAPAPVTLPPPAFVAESIEQASPAIPAPSDAPIAQQVPPADTQSSDVVVTARDTRGDPMSSVNAVALEAAEAVDGALVGPMALAYERNVPSPVRSGLRNFLLNLREPIVFANYVLQLKFGKAAETAGRFLVNSTLGVAGVVDVAKREPFRLPLRRNSFANTLGFYGIGPGPFFFLPLIGPTTLRDLLGTVADQALIPIQPIRPSGGVAYTAPVGVLSALDYRARIEPDLQRQRATGDPYAALRRDYLARRKAEIDRLRGKR